MLSTSVTSNAKERSSSWWTITAAATAAILIGRAIRRHLQPIITAQLQCRCGQIQGQIRAIRPDTLRITCYCQDCRDYAAFVAAQGDGDNQKEKDTPSSCSHIVQVCKSDLTITRGHEHIRLTRKAPGGGGSDSDIGIGMYRYYAGCCSVPLFNTVKQLGFVGILMDTLMSSSAVVVDQFAGPYKVFENEALEQSSPDPSSIPPIGNPPFAFLWRLIRYQPWRSSGPFDYTLTPQYWGKPT